MRIYAHLSGTFKFHRHLHSRKLTQSHFSPTDQLHNSDSIGSSNHVPHWNFSGVATPSSRLSNVKIKNSKRKNVWKRKRKPERIAAQPEIQTIKIQMYLTTAHRRTIKNERLKTFRSTTNRPVRRRRNKVTIGENFRKKTIKKN